MIDPGQSPRVRIPARVRSARRRGRVGTATVELAFCLPVLLTVAFGMLEVTNLIFIQARIQAAAYEAARLATRPTTSNATAATSAQVNTYCQNLLTQLGVNNATITLTPSSLTGATPGTVVTVAISAPALGNSPTSYVLRNSLTLSTQTTLVVE